MSQAQARAVSGASHQAQDGILSLIGHTPMIRVQHMDTGPCELYLKLESQNPGGSIKDRVGLSMIETAERDGLLKPGGVIVEATAGNTGLGLALVASQKGYTLILVIPDKMSQEKIFHLKAMGAEVVMARSDVGKGHPEYYQDVAARIAKEKGAFYVNQFANEANPLAHETSTGPEIWEQMGHKMDAMVCGVGSGGTLSGLGRFFARVAPHVEMILADPKGSILAPLVENGLKVEPGSWLVEGIGEDFIPSICDLSYLKQAFTITDKESMVTAREVLKKEGVLCGSSSGTLIAAALKYCRMQKEPKRVVTFACDSGNKYLSKMFNDYWMLDQGFIEREKHGDLRDLIARPYSSGSTVVVTPGDTLMTAYGRMKMADISQLPVMSKDKIVGIIDEYDILLAVSGNREAFKMEVSNAMTRKVETVDVKAPVEALLKIFDRGMVAVVSDGEAFMGLVTRMDLLNHLRKTSG